MCVWHCAYKCVCVRAWVCAIKTKSQINPPRSVKAWSPLAWILLKSSPPSILTHTHTHTLSNCRSPSLHYNTFQSIISLKAYISYILKSCSFGPSDCCKVAYGLSLFCCHTFITFVEGAPRWNGPKRTPPRNAIRPREGPSSATSHWAPPHAWNGPAGSHLNNINI